ncbi:MAG: ComF family protein [Pseudomonadota bacterium]
MANSKDVMEGTQSYVGKRRCQPGWRRAVNSVMDALSGTLFEEHCELCQSPSLRPLPLCLACEADLSRNQSNCFQCAEPLPAIAGHDKETLCGRCQTQPPAFDRVIAPWLYCPLMAQLIGLWKFQGQHRLTPLLHYLWRQALDETPSADVIVPVPLHWRRLLRRGYNQSGLLCRQILSDPTADPAMRVDFASVKRHRSTPPQSGLDAAKRRANLRGAFTVNGRYDNLRVAIVDDVFTTGATAKELSRVLRAAGAKTLEVWCLARTPSPDY